MVIADALRGVQKTSFLADTFVGMPSAGAADTRFKGGELTDATPDHVKLVAARLGIEKYVVLKGRFPEESGSELGGRPLCFIHIDVDIYESACQTFAFTFPRLVPGGVVVFDDHRFSGCEGVTRFVNSLTHEPNVRFIYNLDGHAILVKVGGGSGTS